jgi:hypothetical protein
MPKYIVRLKGRLRAITAQRVTLRDGTLSVARLIVVKGRKVWRDEFFSIKEVLSIDTYPNPIPIDDGEEEGDEVMAGPEGPEGDAPEGPSPEEFVIDRKLGKFLAQNVGRSYQ